MSEIRGTTADGFEEIRDVFENNFAQNGEVGAGFSLYVDGEEVVNLTGGVTDLEGTPYDEETLQLVFSSTKGATAMCAHLLAERGELDLDEPAANYWPDFAAHGKGDIPVSWLLSHQSGLVDTTARLTLDDALSWDTVTGALADSVPLWEPGTQHGYHAVTYGWLVGEIVRRVSGKSLGTFFADEFAGPLGLEFWIGLPDAQQERVASLIPMGSTLAGSAGSSAGGEESDGGESGGEPSSLSEMLEAFLGPDSLAGKALSAPGGAFADEHIWNDPRVRSAEIPAANGVTNARSLARLYAATVSDVDGVRTLQDDTVDRAIIPQVEGPDSVLVFPIPFALGFMAHSDMSPFIGGRSFGHYGAGGSVGFADPDRKVAGGYVMNQMHMGVTGDPRTAALLSAVQRLTS